MPKDLHTVQPDEVIQIDNIDTSKQELGGIPSFLKDSLPISKSQALDLPKEPERLDLPMEHEQSEISKRKPLGLSQVRQLLAENDMTDAFLIKELKNIILNATRPNPKT